MTSLQQNTLPRLRWLPTSRPASRARSNRRRTQTATMSEARGTSGAGISQGDFFLASAGVFSAGTLYGVRRVMKREKAKLNIRANQPSFMMAMRAFGWGSALCFGGFTIATVAFSLVTGVRTAPEFATMAKRTLVKAGISQEFTEQEKVQLELESQELVRSIEKGWDEITSTFASKVDALTSIAPDSPVADAGNDSKSSRSSESK